MKKKLKYICPECNARYQGPQGATPFIVAWNNGHFCEPKLIGEQEIKKLSNKTKELVEAELWTTYYN